MKRRPHRGRLPFLVLVSEIKERDCWSRGPCGKVGNLVLVFHFSIRVTPGGGNVGISRRLRDFQGAVERGGKLLLLFHAFHRPVISTASSAAPITPSSALPAIRSCSASATALWRRPSSAPLPCRSSSTRLRPVAQSSGSASSISPLPPGTS